MAVPVLALSALLARAATHIITRPTIWVVLLGWFAISQFDLGIAANQLQQSMAELWWLVALILVTAICNIAIRAYFQARRRGD
jgi:hypothetical protein